MRTQGFTLIELLIVVAIIAILAAIAVPNFLEAQTRSKVSRVKADMRTVATAMESYYVDNNKYPWSRNSASAGQYNRGGLQSVTMLSTPIAYISDTRVRDPFREGTHISLPTIQYVNIWMYRVEDRNPPWTAGNTGWAVASYGPTDKDPPIGAWAGTTKDEPQTVGGGYMSNFAYDATNGTISKGYIFRYAGGGGTK
jgi:prepilin-type N-terminal cleavage/methylation domain-containing protein